MWEVSKIINIVSAAADNDLRKKKEAMCIFIDNTLLLLYPTHTQTK
jgi:hypothetical protein